MDRFLLPTVDVYKQLMSLSCELNQISQRVQPKSGDSVEEEASFLALITHPDNTGVLMTLLLVNQNDHPIVSEDPVYVQEILNLMDAMKRELLSVMVHICDRYCGRDAVKKRSMIEVTHT